MRRHLGWVVWVYLAVAGQAAVVYVPDQYVSIQAAIDAAADGDTIIVRPGTYKEILEFRGKAITLQSEAGPECTTIDGKKMGSVVKFIDGEGRDTIIHGFTITNGAGTLRHGYNQYFGGGIRCHQSSVTIVGNIIRDNSVLSGNSNGDGGGIYCWDSAPLIKGNTITGNSAFNGGGICCTHNRPVISDNRIINNASFYGGGVELFGSRALVTLNLITDNVAQYCGGGLASESDDFAELIANRIDGNWGETTGGIFCAVNAQPLIANNIIVGNTGEWNAGGIGCILAARPKIANNIIVRNKTFGLYGRGGGGIYLSENSVVVVINTVIYGNESPNGPELYLDNQNAPCHLKIAFCNVKGGVPVR